MEFRVGLAESEGLERSRRGRRGARRGRRTGLRLAMERLEERVVLSTLNWTGTDSTSTTPGDWSDNVNWGNTALAAGDSITFPTGVSGAALNSNDDLTTSTFGALGSLTIGAPGYSIASTEGYGISLSGTIVDNATSAGSSTLDLPVDFGSTAGSITVSSADSTLLMGGAITGTAGLVTQGSGILDLTGPSATTLTGGTSVNAGTLQVDGSLGDVAVNAGGTLAGSGTVASITTTSGGLTPGSPTTGTGTLTDPGALTMDSGSSFHVTLGGTTAGTDYGQLVAGGAINLNGASLNVSLGNSFDPTPGETFTILSNTSGTAITGTFAQGNTLTVDGYDFSISYAGGTDNQDVVLTAEAAPTSTWTGNDIATSDDWSDGLNWESGNPPSNGDSLIFPGTVTGTALTSNNDLTGMTFNSISIGAASYSLGGNAITLVGSIDSSQSSGVSTMAMPIDISPGGGTVTVDQAGATLDLTSPVTATAGITKDGSGTLDLAGTNGSTAATVSAGTLLVDGSAGAIKVSSGATIGGVGTVGSITTTSGIVSPGDSPTSTGVLTDDGAVTLDSGSSFDVAIGGTTVGTNYDQLSAAGTINLANATLNVSLGSFVPTAGESFTILHDSGAAPVTGTFANQPNGSILTVGDDDFVINYFGGANGQDVVLTSVAPPTATWTGADASASTPNDNWSDPLNWAGDAVPAPGATLIFPTGLSGAALTSNDDISGGTYNSVLIQGSGYTIASTEGYGVSLSGSVDASYGSSDSTWSLPVDFTGTSGTVTVDNAKAGLFMGGVISGSVGLTKQGSGVLDLTATNTFTGTTTAAAGTLLVDGTVADVAVGSTATVGGKGTVGSITTTSGTVSPGDSSSATGVLTDSGALTLDSGSSFDVTLNGTNAGSEYDQLDVGGAINLAGATLTISTGSFNVVPGNTFTILHNTSGTPITGEFVQGTSVTADGYQFSISYTGGTDGDDVVLTAVSPPTIVWSGTDASSGVSDDWSDGANWSGGVAPSAGDIVQFPSGPAGSALTSNNDIANTTFYSLQIRASGYEITGDGIGLATSIDYSATTSTSTIAMPITFNPGAGDVTVDNSGATLLFTGAVTAPTGLVLPTNNAGTVGLEANNGTTAVTVDAGTLQVDGAVGDVAVNTGTTLSGTGTVAEITTVGATIQPADSATATGILTDTGDLVLDSNSTFAATLNGTTAGTGYDQVAVTGSGSTIDLNNATLKVTLGTSFATGAGQQYVIVNNTTGNPITGTFSGLAQGGTVTVGSQQFSISYDGGTNGQDVVLTSLVTTTTSLTVAPTSGVSGQSFTLTASVIPSSGTGTPTGTVSFSTTLNGSTVSLGTATVNSSGVASLTTTKLTAGTNTILATYSGDSTYGTSTSSSLAVVVSQATSTTTLTVTPTTSVYGQLVTLTARIAAVSPGSGAPTGTVQFLENGTDLGSAVTVSGGVAQYTTTTLPVGTDSITAVYSGDTNFTATTSSAVPVVISAASTTVSLSISNNNPALLQTVTLTAIVSSPTTSAGASPTGTVTFETSTGIVLGTGTLSSGEATLTTNSLPVGLETFVAVYSGDSNFGGATSPGLTVVIGHSADLYINQIYMDVFGIQGSYASTYWIGLLNAGYTRKQVVSEILKSRAAKVAEVNYVYEQTLKRPGTSAEQKKILRSGQTSVTPLYAKLYGSAEFYQTQGHGTADGFLTALAESWFGAPFSPTVESHLAGQLARGTSRSAVARQVITSPSGVHAQVNTIVDEILDRPATNQEQKQLSPLVRQGNLIGVYQTIFTSSAFITKYVALS